MVTTIGTGRAWRCTAIAVAVLGAMGVQGCAQQLSQNYNDPGDVCNQQRQPLISLRSTEQQDQINQALVGAVAGALAGAAISAVTGADDTEDILLGAGIGALAGGLAGYSLAYFEQKAEKAETRAQLLGAVDTDAAAERRVLSQTTRAVDGLRNCRDNQIAQIERGIRNGSLSGDQARAQVLAVQSQVQTDNRLISEVIDGADERVTAYVDTTAAASEVDSALLAADRREQQARTARAKVRRTSPNVIRVNDANEMLKTDNARDQEAVDDRIAAMLIQIG